jgi:magnesium chelatase subunit I
MSDFNSVISSINGKVELVYEGEEEGAEQVSYNLISDAIKSLFNKYFPKIEKLSKPDEESPYDSILEWFTQKQLIMNDNLKNEEYEQLLLEVKDASLLLDKYLPELDENDKFFFI